MNKKIVLYIIAAILVLGGIYLVINAAYHSGDKDYVTDPTVKM